ncbi:MAG: hypothetical protein ACRBFS_22975 [Aureispira sp.]
MNVKKFLSIFALPNRLVDGEIRSIDTYFYNAIGVVLLDSFCSATGLFGDTEEGYALILFTIIYFLMPNRENDVAETAISTPNKKALRLIKQELQSLNPNLKRLKVKRFYNQGRVTAHADLGSRRIHVRGNLKNISERFITQYNERFPSAFTHLNTI